MTEEPRGKAKKLVEAKYEWVGGPLDGAHGPAPSKFIATFGNRRAWIGPDPGNPQGVVAYELSLTSPRKAVYSAVLTKKALEMQVRAKEERETE